MSLLNLEQQLTFYAQYHRSKVNIIVHIVCVPIIFWSTLVWSANTGPLLPYEEDSLWRFTPFVPNLSLFTVTFYICYYILLEPVAGALYAPVLLYMAYNATNFAENYPNHNVLAVAVHVFSWIVQFIGHGFAEKRSPALKDNLIQALLLAPLFVWLEVLFSLGYRSELQGRVEKSVQLAVEEHERKRKEIKGEKELKKKQEQKVE
uniref:Putative endoplasmic reticulum membrane protein C16E8.02 n=1 Tax=Anthurium amnicola TaxID=1678845 RepID=A0A1D1Y465_9ARAE